MMATLKGRCPVAKSVAPVRILSGAEQLAAQIRERVLSGELTEETLLAGERDLVSQSGLSRATVREALRILETEGLIYTRPGRNGGTRVRLPDRDHMSRNLGTFIRGNQIDDTLVLEAREYLEVAAAELAALRRTPDDLKLIEAAMLAVEQAQDPEGMLNANIAFHHAIAEASHNALISDFLYSLAATIKDLVYRDEIEGLYAGAPREAMFKVHRRIFSAISDGDGNAAARRMKRHLEGSLKVHTKG